MGAKFDDNRRTFSQNLIRQYFNIIGLDESELKETRIKQIKPMKLNNLSELYYSAEADQFLLESSKDVSSSFEMFMETLDDEYIYETVGERNRALNDAYEILNEVSCIQVAEDDSDPYVLFQRTNNLIKTILGGLAACPKIPNLRLIQLNSSPNTLLNMSRDQELPEDLRKLYGLMALHKISNSNIDEEIFDKYDHIDERKLRKTVRTLIDEQEIATKGRRHSVVRINSIEHPVLIPKNELEEEESLIKNLSEHDIAKSVSEEREARIMFPMKEDYSAKIKTLSFKRPTFKELKSHLDYKRM